MSSTNRAAGTRCAPMETPAGSGGSTWTSLTEALSLQAAHLRPRSQSLRSRTPAARVRHLPARPPRDHRLGLRRLRPAAGPPVRAPRGRAPPARPPRDQALPGRAPLDRAAPDREGDGEGPELTARHMAHWFAVYIVISMT